MKFGPAGPNFIAKIGPRVGSFFHDPGPNFAVKFGPAGPIFTRGQIKSDTGSTPASTPAPVERRHFDSLARHNFFIFSDFLVCQALFSYVKKITLFKFKIMNIYFALGKSCTMFGLNNSLLA